MKEKVSSDELEEKIKNRATELTKIKNFSIKYSTGTLTFKNYSDIEHLMERFDKFYIRVLDEIKPEQLLDAEKLKVTFISGYCKIVNTWHGTYNPLITDENILLKLEFLERDIIENQLKYIEDEQIVEETTKLQKLTKEIEEKSKQLDKLKDELPQYIEKVEIEKAKLNNLSEEYVVRTKIENERRLKFLEDEYQSKTLIEKDKFDKQVNEYQSKILVEKQKLEEVNDKYSKNSEIFRKVTIINTNLNKNVQEKTKINEELGVEIKNKKELSEGLDIEINTKQQSINNLENEFKVKTFEIDKKQFSLDKLNFEIYQKECALTKITNDLHLGYVDMGIQTDLVDGQVQLLAEDVNSFN